MADYGSMSTYVQNAKREAIIAEMTCNGWEFENDNTFTKFENYGESSAGMSVTLDGEAHGYSYNGGVSNDNDEGLAQVALTEFNEVKSKWESSLDTAARGWDDLPEESVYDNAIAQLQEATKMVATGGGNGGSKFGNPNLTDIGFIRERLPQNSGQTVDEFYRLYGPEKLELVFDGVCEVVACLGVALAGEKRVLERTRLDVATIFEALEGAFKQTRQNNSTDWKTTITVLTAGIGLVGAFGAGVPGLATAVGAATATGGFLTAAMAALSEGSEDPQQNSGSSPDDVYTDLTSALGRLDEHIASVEEDLATMLSNMTGYVGDPGNRLNFHLDPDSGLAPSFGKSDDVIDLKYPVLETIGYVSMPKIAKGFLDAADAAQAGQDQPAWYRPFASVPGSSIGNGPYGAYYEWESLLYAIFPLLNSNGAEVVRAGEHLAEAAGYVKESDEWARKALGDDYQDIKDAGLGWEKPYVEPTPPVPPSPRGGHHIPY